MSRSAAGTVGQQGRNVRAKSGLNRSILDQGWYEMRRQLEYKQLWRGGQVLAVRSKHTQASVARAVVIQRKKITCTKSIQMQGIWIYEA
ncbi:hypothetical protein ACLB1O_30165 [Escherichia coli]